MKTLRTCYKPIVVALVSAGITLPASADNDSKPRPIVENGKWGYMNDEGEVVIQAKFDQVGPFHDGLARVKSAGLWGYINQDGRSVLNPMYTEATDFSSELAAVRKDGKWGYINKEGTFIVHAMYDDAKAFSEGAPASGTTGNGASSTRTEDGSRHPNSQKPTTCPTATPG